ncbi:MAG: HAD-IIB family hydrolase [Thermanaerothrix sp.]|nr:HAD-IIB family hydrolase [Thermanaerothrix sp.]
MIKLLAFDLDGTILDDRGCLPAEREELLRELAERGMRMTFVTGRMFRSAMRFAERVTLGAPVVAYNGAMIVDAMGIRWYHDPIPPETSHRVLRFFRDLDVYVQAYRDEELLVEEASSPRARYYAELSGVDPLEMGGALFDEPFASTKILAVEEDLARLERISKEAQLRFPDLEFYTSKGHFLEVMRRHVNKGSSLELLCGLLGLKPQEVLVMGDGDNDRHMLGRFPTSVAVASASKGAKEAARFQVPPGIDPVRWIWENLLLAHQPLEVR